MASSTNSGETRRRSRLLLVIGIALVGAVALAGAVVLATNGDDSPDNDAARARRAPPDAALDAQETAGRALANLYEAVSVRNDAANALLEKYGNPPSSAAYFDEAAVVLNTFAADVDAIAYPEESIDLADELAAAVRAQSSNSRSIAASARDTNSIAPALTQAQERTELAAQEALDALDTDLRSRSG